MDTTEIPLLVPECPVCPAPSRTRVDTRRSWFGIVFLLFSTLPSVLGSCCWPLLLAGAFDLVATASARALSHSLTLAVDLAVTTNIVQFMAMKQHVRPALLAGSASLFIVADPLRHVLLDAGIASDAWSMYRTDCSPTEGLRGFRCLTVVGWLIPVGCTLVGNILMIASVMWATRAVSKILRAIT